MSKTKQAAVKPRKWTASGLRTQFPPDHLPRHEITHLTDEAREEYAKINIPGVPQANPDYAPNTLDFRYLTEDVPFGLVPVHQLEQVSPEQLRAFAVSCVHHWNYRTIHRSSYRLRNFL